MTGKIKKGSWRRTPFFSANKSVFGKEKKQIMKHIITGILLIMSTAMIAQTTMINKTTITVDKSVDGKIVKEVYVIEGEGADKKLKELENDKSVININVEKQVEMSSDDPNNVEMQKMRKEVEVKIADMEKATGKKADRREENIEIEVTEDDQKEIKEYKMKIIENGKEEVIEWNGEGEMPAKMKKMMDDTETQINVKGEGREARKYHMTQNNKKANGMTITDEEVIIMNEENNNKGQIGVMIRNIASGVEILSFTDNSMAMAAGLKIGDVITGVNSKTVTTMEDLVEGLALYEPGDVVTINYMRDNRTFMKEVKLNKR